MHSLERRSSAPQNLSECLTVANSNPSDAGVAFARFECQEKFKVLAPPVNHTLPLDREPSANTTGTAGVTGWTKQSSGTSESGPWFNYDPVGTRYYRNAGREIVRLFPPGVETNAPQADADELAQSSAEIPK